MNGSHAVRKNFARLGSSGSGCGDTERAAVMTGSLASLWASSYTGDPSNFLRSNVESSGCPGSTPPAVLVGAGSTVAPKKGGQGGAEPTEPSTSAQPVALSPLILLSPPPGFNIDGFFPNLGRVCWLACTEACTLAVSTVGLAAAWVQSRRSFCNLCSVGKPEAIALVPQVGHKHRRKYANQHEVSQYRSADADHATRHTPR